MAALFLGGASSVPAAKRRPGMKPKHCGTTSRKRRRSTDAFLRTGEGRWRVDLVSARWAPSDEEFDQLDVISDQLERQLHILSVPDDEMTV